MGNEESTPVDESTATRTLPSQTVEAVAEYIRSGRARQIVVMTGAGISTSAGIPDFRSPETGLYANLARLELPYAEAVFDIAFFRQRPEPFYALAHELYPGRYRPTVTHAFLRLLHDKGLLLRLFTQNIDCLERAAGVPAEKIVEAHGSFATQACIDCHAPFPDDEMRQHVHERTIPRCAGCGGLVKPGIVFFGEALPPDFFAARMLAAEADLAIIIGTSLTVHPFASLPQIVPVGVPRLLLNKEQVGGLGSRLDDVLLLGDCDDGVRRLARACGWLEELEALWAQTAPQGGEGKEEEKKEEKSKDELLGDEIDQLTKEVDETLNLSKWHQDRVKREGQPHQPELVPEKVEESRTKLADTAAAAATGGGEGGLAHVFVGGPRVDSFTPAGEPKADDHSKL